MHIPSQLPQFSKEKALIIIAGKFNAKLYSAYQSELTELSSFTIEKVIYDDKKTVYSKPGGAVGEIEENNDPIIQQDFIKEFNKSFKIALKNSFDTIYIFAVPQRINLFKEILPKNLLPKIKKSINGNFTKIQPLELLEKLK